jgi:FkbM family methyltransferase
MISTELARLDDRCIGAPTLRVNSEEPETEATRSAHLSGCVGRVPRIPGRSSNAQITRTWITNMLNKEHRLAQALLRSWPFPRGAGRILDRYFSYIRFESKTATVRTTDGFEILVEPNDLIGRHLYLTGEFDRSIVDVLCKFSEPGDALLDIGANIGYVSSCFLNNVPRSSVIAVEPQADVLEILRANLSKFGRFQIYPYALGDKDGEVFFQLNPDNKGSGHLSATGTTKIEMRSASRLFSDLSIDRVDVVKIDAEGCEEMILNACAPDLGRLHPRMILFEHLGQSTIPQLLSEIDYQVFGIKKLLHKLALRHVSGEEDCGYHDYVAVSRNRPVPYAARALIPTL